MVLATKKGGKCIICIDSRRINRITIRYRFSIPRIEDLMDYLDGARYFSKTDLKSVYYHIRKKGMDGSLHLRLLRVSMSGW